MEIANTELRLKQELVNSILHGFGILFGIISIPILLMIAVKSGNMPGIVGSGVYGFSFLLTFTTSTLYHGSQNSYAKNLFKKLDHISIYLLIAGTYTPFLLIYQQNNFGNTLLWLLWILAGAGIIFKWFYCGRWEIFSTAVYLLMGWIMLSGGNTFFAKMPGSVSALVIIGCCLYTVGVIFYLWEKYTYSHAVWHLFVLAAAVCHYVAVLMSV